MAKTLEREFGQPKESVFSACQLAVAELGYAVKHSDAASGILSFNTGRSMKTWAGQDLTVTLLSAGDKTRVIVGGSMAQSGATIQVGAWGEKSALSKKFLNAVEAALQSDYLPEPQAGSDRKENTSLADEIAKLSLLRDQGILTEEEFKNAKARLLGL
jgi:membrane protease subunit (stomatin/prohibitin family)